MKSDIGEFSGLLPGSMTFTLYSGILPNICIGANVLYPRVPPGFVVLISQGRAISSWPELRNADFFERTVGTKYVRGHSCACTIKQCECIGCFTVVWLLP